jgi:hypothetical protein
MREVKEKQIGYVARVLCRSMGALLDLTTWCGANEGDQLVLDAELRRDNDDGRRLGAADMSPEEEYPVPLTRFELGELVMQVSAYASVIRQCVPAEIDWRKLVDGVRYGTMADGPEELELDAKILDDRRDRRRRG